MIAHDGNAHHIMWLSHTIDRMIGDGCPIERMPSLDWCVNEWYARKIAWRCDLFSGVESYQRKLRAEAELRRKQEYAEAQRLWSAEERTQRLSIPGSHPRRRHPWSAEERADYHRARQEAREKREMHERIKRAERIYHNVPDHEVCLSEEILRGRDDALGTALFRDEFLARMGYEEEIQL